MSLSKRGIPKLTDSSNDVSEAESHQSSDEENYDDDDETFQSDKSESSDDHGRSATELKEDGNMFFSQSNYDMAIHMYRKALETGHGQCSAEDKVKCLR